MTKRLQQDHDNALMLAKGLAACPHIDIRTDLVRAAMSAMPCMLCLTSAHMSLRVCCYEPQAGMALLLQIMIVCPQLLQVDEVHRQ